MTKFNESYVISGTIGSRFLGHPVYVVTPEGASTSSADTTVAYDLVAYQANTERSTCEREAQELGSCAVRVQVDTKSNPSNTRFDVYRTVCDSECAKRLPVESEILIEVEQS